MPSLVNISLPVTDKVFLLKTISLHVWKVNKIKRFYLYLYMDGQGMLPLPTSQTKKKHH
jgi:hypothetical protein